MRKITMLIVVLLCSTTLLFAQTTINGKVTDSKDGTALFGATVKVKGSPKATTTDAGGNYSLSVPAMEGTIEISLVGFNSQNFKITSKRNSFNVSMLADTKGLTEVVVTGMGIKKEKKALGYAVSTVNKKDIELRPEGDIGRILNGKAAGVNILNSSGISGSGTNITIRALGTITGNSTPLFIVDGVPFEGGTNANGNFTYGNQTSSRFLDLDPGNIDNVSILKGLSATTLYGELGRNGVILITTKNSGAVKGPKKTEISLSQSYFVNTIANLPEYNTRYGGGFDLSNGVTFFSNWGGEFSNPPVLVPHPYGRTALNAAFPEFKGATYEYRQYKNNVKDFFRTGNVVNTSLNIGGTGANASYNANLSYLDDVGFLPGNNLKKLTFGVGGIAKLSNNFTVTGSFNYVSTKVKSPPTSTSFGSTATNASVFGDVLYTPTSVDLQGLPWENPLDKSHVYYRTNNGIQNPRWTLANSFTEDNSNRAFGNIQLKYDIGKDFLVSYRIGYDNFSETQIYAQNKGGSYTPEGLYRTSIGINTIYDQALLTSFKRKLNSNFNLGFDGGVNIRNDDFKQTGITSTNQLVFGLLNHNNFVNHLATSESGGNLDFQVNRQSVGVFLQSTLDFKDYIFLNLGGRNSWTSATEKGNNSLFYPSASVSFIPTSLFEGLKNSRNINYLKARLAYGTSAEFANPYLTRGILGVATKVFVDGANTSINTNSINGLLPNSDLGPSLIKEIEFGIEGKLFDNRLNFDFTFYNRDAKDQILFRDIDPSAGYNSQAINGGNVNNKGIELQLGYTVVRNSSWKWQIDGLFSRNRSLVSGIPDGITAIRTAGFTNLGTFAINGQPLGVIQGRGFQRAPNGEKLVASNGWYLTDNTIKIIGDPTPDFKLTGISTLTYKALSFRVQMDYTQGGDFYSATSSVLLGRGVTRDTEFDRAIGYILPGVLEDGKTQNNKQISATEAYFNNTVAGGSADEAGIYDATVIRIREASIAYSFPQKLLRKTPFGAVSFSVSGNNLWYYAPNFPKYVNFDPETSGLGVSNGRGLEFFTGPSSRRVGASLRITF